MNKEIKKVLKTLTYNELKSVATFIDLKGRSNLNKQPLLNKIIKDGEEGLIEKALIKMGKIQRQRKLLGFFIGSGAIKNKPKKIQNVETNKNKVSLILLLMGSIMLPFLLDPYKYDIATFLLEKCVCSNSNGNVGINKVHDAIDNNHKIKIPEDQYEQNLKRLIADEVNWFNVIKSRDESFFSKQNEYDMFCYCDILDIHSSDGDSRNGYYNFNFMGLHRYKKPKENLYKIEEGSAIVNNNLVVEVLPIKVYQSKYSFINSIYKNFKWSVFGLSIFLIFLKYLIPNRFWENIWEALFGFFRK